jgi:hypothetical protein
MRKSNGKPKTTRKKTINNTTKKERGVDSLEVTLRERSSIEVGSRT